MANGCVLALVESSRNGRSGFPILEVTFGLDESQSEGGRLGRGHVHLRNTGQRLIERQSERPIRVTTLDRRTLDQVGGQGGPILGTGLAVRLDPGEVAAIPILVDTFSRKDDTLALPSGEYLVNVEVPVFERQLNGEGSQRSCRPLTLISGGVHAS